MLPRCWLCSCLLLGLGLQQPGCARDSEPQPKPRGSEQDAAAASASAPRADAAGAGAQDAGDAAPSQRDAQAPRPTTQHCDAPSAGPVQALFEVPGARGSTGGDYFRLPFPNDHYLEDGKLELGAFVTTTDAARAVVDALNGNARGFGTSPTVIFRFSGPIDFERSARSRFHLLDVTEPSGAAGPEVKLSYFPAGGKYVCHDWLAARPVPGATLTPGHSYVAWLEAGVLDESGEEVEASPQLEALLEAAPPEDPELAALHEKYAPYRAYLAEAKIEPSQVLNATLFTIDDVGEPMRQLAARVEAAGTPRVSRWTRCGGVDPSPCPDTTGTRACEAPEDSYEEYHALLELPIFQTGTPPYIEAGGAISAAGVERTEPVCISLTVPVGAPPETGFPVLVAAHGAGGSFRSAVRPYAAGALSRFSTPDGVSRRVAVLGYDGVQHGPRRGTDPVYSQLDPDLLLFNFFNPEGTLGTSLQGAADVLSVTRFARTLELPPEVTERADLHFDPGPVSFWGHSQGAMQGAVALPYTDDVTAAVFSGLGAGFGEALLLRKQPELVPQAVRLALGDPGESELVVGLEFHPLVALVQQLVDPADPLNHAAALSSPSSGQPVHVFQVYGAADTYAPGVTQRAFATAAKLVVVQADPSAVTPEDLGAAAVAPPLQGNIVWRDGSYTAGVRQYGPALDRDGHFVAFEVNAANQDVLAFIGMAAAGQTPQIGR